MAGFQTYGEIDDAYTAGRYTIAGFRKAVTATTTQGIWFDLSMTGGGPIPNYYAAAPLTWTVLRQSTDGGLRHGGDVSPAKKCLKSIMVCPSVVTTSTPLPMIVLDYLGYYPFVDMAGSFGLTGSGLTRYTDGVGVQVMPVLVAPQTGGCSFYITYTGPQGSGRQSQTVICNTATVNGTIVTTGPTLTATYQSSPFIGLQTGDTGVKSIESITWLSDDVGLIALVLVKPLATIALDPIALSVYSPTEKDFVKDVFGSLPVIQDDAYLNFICYPSGTLATAAIYGIMETVWSA